MRHLEKFPFLTVVSEQFFVIIQKYVLEEEIIKPSNVLIPEAASSRNVFCAAYHIQTRLVLKFYQKILSKTLESTNV